MFQEKKVYRTIESLKNTLHKTTDPFAPASAFASRRVIGFGLIAFALLIAIVVNSLANDSSKAVVDNSKPTNNNENISPESALASATMQFDEVIPVDRGLPDIHVTSALVKELGSQENIFSYRPRARWPIASITKLMTAVVALDELAPNTLITISQEAVDTEGEAGLLKVGEKYSVTDLIKAMLLVSSNDSAVALAQAYEKKELGAEKYEQALSKTALFVSKMQDRARILGMEETYFGDPSGLSMVNQSVVGDLAVLLNHIQTTYPTILEIARQKQVSILDQKRMARRTLISINQFAGQKDFLGGKTGFTDEAGQNLVSIFSYNGKKYVIAVLGTEDRFGETTKLYDWLKKTVAK